MSKLTRDILSKLAQDKAEAARTLLRHDLHTDAYYLAGYAAEIALKAIIAKEFLAETLPDKKRVNDIYTHDLEALITLAGLRSGLNDKLREDQILRTHWDVVKSWNESSRYFIRSRGEAYAMVNSIVAEDGVLPWILSFR